MRRALLSEQELAALRRQSDEVGLPCRIFTDCEGEAEIHIGGEPFPDVDAARAALARHSTEGARA